MSKSPGKLKILVCEDNTLTLKILEISLKKMGHEVILATDGEQGMNLLESEDIQLLITDINMPYNNGLELVQYVRKKYGKQIPIIIVSNINHAETRNHAIELGVDGYITKPFDPEELTTMIDSFQIFK
jgi:DNA-binding response OmpR family regulator